MRRWLPLGVLVLVLSLPYWFIQSQFVLAMATLTLIWIAIGTAWNIISGFGGQISFGHSVFFGIGAYAVVLLYLDAHVNPWLGLLAGGLLAGIFSLWMIVAFRLRGIYFALVTFAATLIFQDLADHFRGLTGGDVGLSVPLLGNRPDLFQFRDPVVYYFIAAGFAAACMAAAMGIYHSRLGISLRAVGDDQAAADASGVPVLRVKVEGLFVSAFMTGVMGAVYMQVIQFIDPSTAFGFGIATQIVILPLAGGLGSLWGPVLGGAILYPLQQVLNVAFSQVSASVGVMVYGVLLVVILTRDRRGLYGLLTSLYARLAAGLTRHPPAPREEVGAGARFAEGEPGGCGAERAVRRPGRRQSGQL